MDGRSGWDGIPVPAPMPARRSSSRCKLQRCRRGVEVPRRSVVDVARIAALAVALAIGAAIRLDAQFPGELAGQVVSGATREPVADARIEAAGSGIVVVSDAVGRFRL